MELLSITLASILSLTALAWVVRRVALPRLCPLCAGVSGTWIALVAAYEAGFDVDLRLTALLLGGSVVGLAGLGESALAGRSAATVLTWKTIFVATGFAVAYAMLRSAWPWAGVGGLLLLALLLVPWLVASRQRRRVPHPTEGQERLLAQLKNCC